MVAVRRAPVRSEADRKGRQAGDLPEVSAVPVGGQLPETPGSHQGGEEGDLTGRRPALRRMRPAPEPENEGGVRAPPAVTWYGSSVMMTTDTELKISEEPLAERVLRQVRFGEARRVPAAALGRKAVAGRGQEAGPARVAAGLVHLHGRLGVRGGDREGAREAERGGHGGGAGHAVAVGGVAVRARSGGGVRRADRGRA